jgi:hypothetical protein
MVVNVKDESRGRKRRRRMESDSDAVVLMWKVILVCGSNRERGTKIESSLLLGDQGSILISKK